MPSRNQIYRTIVEAQSKACDTVRRTYLKLLSEYTNRDVILYSSAFLSFKPGVPAVFISITNQDIQGFMASLEGLKKKKLDLILHSPGGSLEAAEQIVKYLRNKYSHIRAIIPQNAMSAATMIACACDEIVLGKHSAIGPIDPQITFNTPTGPFTAPAQSILDEFEQAKQEIMQNPKDAVLWIKRIDKYPPGFLKMCENTIQLSKQRVEEWLSSWMFASDEKKHAKAKKIADWLGSAKYHLTHAHPIDIKEAKSKGLHVIPLENDQKLQELVLSVFHSTMATHDLTACVKFIENQFGKGYYINVKSTGTN
ncbi:MAG: serine protease [Candidatus Hydrogenedentota bacterium]|nr:MAG: serine protease [Candidatus Hydrogenedentota bacterium]